MAGTAAGTAYEKQCLQGKLLPKTSIAARSVRKTPEMRKQQGLAPLLRFSSDVELDGLRLVPSWRTAEEVEADELDDQAGD